MNVIIRDFPDDLVESLKATTMRKTASGAVVDACGRYLLLLEHVADLQRQLAAVNEKARHQGELIRHLRDSVAALALFDDTPF